jgi:hypothetical protein
LNRILIFIAAVVWLSACESALTSNKGTVLARVNDKYLYEEDIEGIVPKGTSKRDSIVLVRNYVNNWVKTELMIQQARKNLAVQQLDLDSQLEAYRNSLIIYHYESELIKQKLDTLVSEGEIETYYTSHLSDFELKENIAKVHYVIIDSEPELAESLEEVYALPDSLLLDSLEAFCKEYARSYFLDTAAWLRFDDLTDVIPLETYNQELFLKGNRKIQLEDENYTYLLTFVDFRIKEDASPLDFEREDIRAIIVNKRKLDLVKQARQDIYAKALQNGEFEIYQK